MGKVDLIRLDIFPIPTNCVNNAQKYFIQIVLRNKNFYLPQQVLIQHLCLNDPNCMIDGRHYNLCYLDIVAGGSQCSDY